MSKRRDTRPITLKLLDYAKQALRDDMQWPQPTGPFSHLSVALAKAVSSMVLDSTWDASSMDEWDWDPYKQMFAFDVHSVFRMGGEIQSRPVQIRSRFYFDPKKDLLAELNRVANDVKLYSDNLLMMQQQYHEARKRGDAHAFDSDE